MNTLARAFALIIVIVFAFFGGVAVGSPKPAAAPSGASFFLEKDLGRVTTFDAVWHQVDRVIPNAKHIGIKAYMDGGEWCMSDRAAACVSTAGEFLGWMHFKSDAFSFGETKYVDSPQDRYIVLHEAAHTALLLKYGSHDAAEAAAIAAGFGGFSDRDGNPLPPIEAQAECVALSLEPTVSVTHGGGGGGYIDACDDFGLILSAFDLIGLDWLEVVERELAS